MSTIIALEWITAVRSVVHFTGSNWAIAVLAATVILACCLVPLAGAIAVLLRRAWGRHVLLIAIGLEIVLAIYSLSTVTSSIQSACVISVIFLYALMALALFRANPSMWHNIS